MTARDVFYISIILGLIMIVMVMRHYCKAMILRYSALAEKNLCNTQLLAQLVKRQQEGFDLEKHIAALGYKRIALYGLNDFGAMIAEGLKKGEVKIEYGIDNGTMVKTFNFPVITSNDELIDVDAILVTAVYYFDDIEKELRQKTDCPIVSLGDVLFD